MAKIKAHREWLAPGQIKFTSAHVHWLFDYWECIDVGYWPSELSGATSLPGTRNTTAAYFEQVMSVKAELTWRLGQCGKDGKLVLRCFGDKWNVDQVAELLDCSPGWLKRRMRRAIAFAASGPERRYVMAAGPDGEMAKTDKLLSYRDFVGHRRPKG